jgi:predicted nucleic acid-binding Zn ribbon protein
MNRFLRDGKSIGGVWNDYMKNSKLNRKMVEHDITARWEELAGSLVARHTNHINYYENKLTIYLDSASLKQEVLMRKDSLIDRINTNLNSQLIKDIIIR